MKLGGIKQLQDFLRVVDSCKGEVWIETSAGDRFSLKSEFSKYIAIDRLIENERGNYELFCSNAVDENKMFRLFGEYPEMR